MNLRPSQPVGELLGPLAERIGARGVSHPETRVSGVTLRSQDVLPGDLFAALPGSSAHGARYAVDAVRAGAVAVLTDPAGASALEPHPDVDVLVHPTPRAVLGEVAAAVYGHPSRRLRVIGVTGTSGKTTTTYLVEAGLRAAGRVAGLIGTVGIRIDGRDEPSALTTPEAPDLQALLAVMVERGVDTVVMEVSSHALTLGRVDGVVFEAGAFTNLSRDHLDFHPTMADYLNAKARLFERESPIHAAHAVVCVDDDAGRQIAARAESPVRISTTGGVADWGVEAVHAVGRGTQQFVAVDPAGVHHTLRIALPGRYNIANALLAVALLDVIGVSPEQSAPGLRGAAVPGRLQAVDGGQDFLALVDYAHKPGALEAVLQTLRGYGGQERSDQGIGTGGQERSDRGIGTGGQERSDRGIRTQGRLAVVFGAGGNRDAGKREPMGRIAAELADLVVVTDDNPRDEDPAVIRSAILAGAVDQPAEVVEIGDRRAAIEFAVGWARPGDVVLIAGKGHESGQTSGGQTRPFDDRTELAGALAALGHHP